MRIGEFARAAGISADSVRFYERSGLLPRPPRQANGYREYTAADVEHVRLLAELRRLDIPLDEAARIARWCHGGHCAETTQTLPQVLAAKRREIAARIDSLRALDARLGALDRHLSGQLPMATTQACCEAAAAVEGSAGGCACCGAAT